MAPYSYSLSPYGSYYSDFANDVLRVRSRSKTPFVSISELDSSDKIITTKKYTYSRTANALDLATPTSIYPRTYTYVRPSYLDLVPYRRYYPYHSDLSYYLSSLIPYYYHPRPVYQNYYEPHYHYHTPTTRTTTVTRRVYSYPHYYEPVYYPNYYSTYYSYLY